MTTNWKYAIKRSVHPSSCTLLCNNLYLFNNQRVIYFKRFTIKIRSVYFYIMYTLLEIFIEIVSYFQHLCNKFKLNFLIYQIDKST